MVMGSLVGGVLPLDATEDVSLSVEGLALEIGVCSVNDTLSAFELDATGARNGLGALLAVSVDGFVKNDTMLFCFIAGVVSGFF